MSRSITFALAAVVVVCNLTLGDDVFPAHRVVGNVYYVGSEALAIYLNYHARRSHFDQQRLRGDRAVDPRIRRVSRFQDA